MDFAEAIKSVYTKYATFSGRARRSEYWNFFLFNILVSVLTILLAASLAWTRIGPVVVFTLSFIAGIASIVPGLAVTVRRLHDTGKPGAYYFFSFIPVVGYIILLVWLATDSMPGPNQYGPCPKDMSFYAGVQNGSGAGQNVVIVQTPTPQVKVITQGNDMMPQGSLTLSPGLPAQRHYAIACVSGELQGQVFPLGSAPLDFGRDVSCLARFSRRAPGVSSLHCSVSQQGGTAMLVDQGSSYGTFVRGGMRLQAGSQVMLAEGDEFMVGSPDNRFRLVTYMQ